MYTLKYKDWTRSVEKDVLMQIGLIKDAIEGDNTEIIEIPQSNLLPEEIMEKIMEFCIYEANPANEKQIIEKPIRKANYLTVPFYTNFINSIVQSQPQPDGLPRPQPDGLTLKEVKTEEILDCYNKIAKYIIAANYLNISQLLELTASYVAYMLKDKSTEELKKYIGSSASSEQTQ